MKSAEILRSMAYDIRLDIIRYIDVHGEASVNEIVKYCQMTQSAVSQHLAVLRKTGVLKSRKDKQTRYYSLACDLPMKIIDLIDNYENNQN